MTASNETVICYTCGRETTTYPCPGCSKYFCGDDRIKHREELKLKFHEIEDQRNQFVEILNDHKNNENKHPLFNRITQWERESIDKIQQTAEEQRNLLQHLIYEHTQKIETKLNTMTDEMQKIDKRKDSNELVLDKLETQLECLKQQLSQPNHIQVKEGSSSTYINKISVIDTSNTGSQGVLKCPNRYCEWTAEVEDPNSRFRAKCPLCGHEFCSICSQQYHYRTACQQLPELTQRWFLWCDTERGNHWKVRARQDASYRIQLQEYERQQGANEQRNNELRQLYNELLNDEQYKTKYLCPCPHCKRLVYRIEGSDLVICGLNYCSGDRQSGCGKDFHWRKAAPYVPMTDHGLQRVKDDLRALKDNPIVHKGVQCNACHNEVHGIRFECIHCRSLIFCEKCEQRATLEHANEVRAQNQPRHIFRVITTV